MDVRSGVFVLFSVSLILLSLGPGVCAAQFVASDGADTNPVSS